MFSAAARKFQIALGAAVATGAALWIADGNFSRDDIVATVIAFLGALGVYVKSNKPQEGR
jgi:hypothetical protein